MFFGGVASSDVPAFTISHLFIYSDLVCILIAFFSPHRLSAVWQSQYCSIDLGRGSCDNPVPGCSPHCTGAAPSGAQELPPAQGSCLKRRRRKKNNSYFYLFDFEGKKDYQG